MTQDYQVTCTSGAVRFQSALTAAFNRVARRDNWKIPVDATIADTDRALIRDAVIHFTGSVPTISALPNGKIRVKAAGYYAAVGA